MSGHFPTRALVLGIVLAFAGVIALGMGWKLVRSELRSFATMNKWSRSIFVGSSVFFLVFGACLLIKSANSLRVDTSVQGRSFAGTTKAEMLYVSQAITTILQRSADAHLVTLSEKDQNRIRRARSILVGHRLAIALSVLRPELVRRYVTGGHSTLEGADTDAIRQWLATGLLD